MNSLGFFIYSFVIAHCFWISSVEGVCCGSKNYLNCPALVHACGDCTYGTPYCGYGKCNVFGCACAGGCRTGECDNCQLSPAQRRKRDTAASTSSTNGTDIVQEADQDQDGKLNLDEAMNFLYAMQIAIPEDLLREGIIALDQNRDGFLMHSEIDPHD